MASFRTVSRSIAPLVGALLCAILVRDVAASPLPAQDNVSYNNAVYSQPEYLEAIAKELEKEGPTGRPTWWIRYCQEFKNDPGHQQDTSLRDKLDQIGSVHLLRRNLDPIGGGNLVKRNLDPIGGGNLLRSLHQEPAARDRFYGLY